MKVSWTILVLAVAAPVSAQPRSTVALSFRHAPRSRATPAPAPRSLHVTTGGDGEVAAPKPRIDPHTVQRVFGAKLSADSALVASDPEQPVFDFELDTPEKPLKKRRISVMPTGYPTGGQGVKVKIPF